MNIRDRQAIHHAAGQSLENAKGEPQKILLVYLVWWRAPDALCIYSSVTLEDARPAWP